MPDRPVMERLEVALLARLNTSAAPGTAAELASALERYAPAGIQAARWYELVAACVQELERRELVGADRRAARTDELKRQTGARAVTRWLQWSERILPGLALGVRGDDTKAHKRLADRDAWSAAIVARALGHWTTGTPPSAPALCDALIWRALDLASTPRRCPAELRAHFLRKHIEIDSGPPDRMLRQLAAKLIGAPRVELKAFYAALIRMWLTGTELGAGAAVHDRVPDPAPVRTDHAADQGPVEGASPVAIAPSAAEPARPFGPGARIAADDPSLIDAVRSAARGARDGVFGDRKVFIASVWSALRAMPPWSQLDLDEFKARLVLAHRRRELVLARADLVAAMDPALVASSETRTEGATFHFIVREPVQ